MMSSEDIVAIFARRWLNKFKIVSRLKRIKY